MAFPHTPSATGRTTLNWFPASSISRPRTDNTPKQSVSTIGTPVCGIAIPSLGNDSQRLETENKKHLILQGYAAKQGVFEGKSLGDTGFDSVGDAKAETAVGPELYAPLYAHDPQLARLIGCWPRLTDEDRQALADHAEHLAAGRIRFA